METLLDVLASSRGVAHLALQVEETGARVPRHFSFDALAAEAAHVLLHIPLVETVDHWALVTPLE